MFSDFVVSLKQMFCICMTKSNELRFVVGVPRLSVKVLKECIWNNDFCDIQVSVARIRKNSEISLPLLSLVACELSLKCESLC